MLRIASISAASIFVAAIAFSPTATAVAPAVGAPQTEAAAESVYGSAADPVLVPTGVDSVSLTPESGSSGQAFSVTLPESDYSLSKSKIVDNGSPDSHSTTFVDQNSDGVTIYTTSLNDKAESEFEYGISGVSDPYLVPLGDGSFAVLDADDKYVANLGEPWAVDSAGTPVTTSYELESGILTQHLNYSDSTQFPVTADPVVLPG